MARSLSASSAAWAVAAAGGPTGAGAIGRGVGTTGPPQAPENTAATEGGGRGCRRPTGEVTRQRRTSGRDSLGDHRGEFADPPLRTHEHRPRGERRIADQSRRGCADLNKGAGHRLIETQQKPGFIGSGGSDIQRVARGRMYIGWSSSIYCASVNRDRGRRRCGALSTERRNLVRPEGDGLARRRERNRRWLRERHLVVVHPYVSEVRVENHWHPRENAGRRRHAQCLRRSEGPFGP